MLTFIIIIWFSPCRLDEIEQNGIGLLLLKNEDLFLCTTLDSDSDQFVEIQIQASAEGTNDLLQAVTNAALSARVCH